MKALKAYEGLLARKPIVTKCITSFITFGFGDILCQMIEKKQNFDWKRAFIQGSFGFNITPWLHIHFCKILPFLFPGNTKTALAKSVFYDQTVNAAIFTTTFFLYLDMCSGKNFETAYNELKIKFLPVLYDNWKVWPILMAFNFSVVPMQYRVLFSNFCGMIWVAYLSYFQNVMSKKQTKE
jgi:protein Mpv17